MVLGDDDEEEEEQDAGGDTENGKGRERGAGAMTSAATGEWIREFCFWDLQTTTPWLRSQRQYSSVQGAPAHPR